jgi:hypothetical protein
LFAVAVVKALTVDVGVRVSVLAPVAEDLFRFANDSAWATIERSTLLFDFGERRLTAVAETAAIRATGTAVHVACRPIVAGLRDRLLADQTTDPQQMLRFPPAVVGSRTGTGGEQQ